MQVTIDLPDKLTDEVQKQWGDLSQWILSHLLLDAMKTGMITFDEFKELLNFSSEEELNTFLRQNNMLHDGGLLNLAGSCADFDIEVDDLDELNISDQGRRKANEVYVMTLLEMGEITSGRAARLLGLSRLDVVDMVNRRGISIFDDSQDLEALKQEVDRAEFVLNQAGVG